MSKADEAWKQTISATPIAITIGETSGLMPGDIVNGMIEQAAHQMFLSGYSAAIKDAAEVARNPPKFFCSDDVDGTALIAAIERLLE
jgi:hypothetical protein